MRYQEAGRRNEDLQSYLLIHRYGQDTDSCFEPRPAELTCESRLSPWYRNGLEDAPRIVIDSTSSSASPAAIVGMLAATAEAEALSRPAEAREPAPWGEPSEVDGYVAHREQWL
jgi:hypothetical protein